MTWNVTVTLPLEDGFPVHLTHHRHRSYVFHFGKRSTWAEAKTWLNMNTSGDGCEDDNQSRSR